MRIEEILRRIAREDRIKPPVWKVEAATKWQITGASEPEESGGARISYEDVEGGWRYFGELELTSGFYGLNDTVAKLLVDDDAPASIVIPFMEAFKHSALTVELRPEAAS